MARRRRRAASPRWRGRAARTGRSAQPSMVQCPELCTRGAISLTSRPAARDEQLDARSRRRSRARSGSRAATSAASLRSAPPATRGGHGRSVQDAVAVHVLAADRSRDRAVEPARRDHRDLARRSRRTPRGPPARRRHAASAAAASPADVDPRLALAVVARAAGSSGSPGGPIRARAARRSAARPSTAA